MQKKHFNFGVCFHQKKHTCTSINDTVSSSLLVFIIIYIFNHFLLYIFTYFTHNNTFSKFDGRSSPSCLRSVFPIPPYFFPNTVMAELSKGCTLYHSILCQYGYISLWTLYQRDHDIFMDMICYSRTTKNYIGHRKKH